MLADMVKINPVLKRFMMIKIIPVGNGHCQFVQFLQITDAMRIRLGVPAFQD